MLKISHKFSVLSESPKSPFVTTSFSRFAYTNYCLLFYEVFKTQSVEKQLASPCAGVLPLSCYHNGGATSIMLSQRGCYLCHAITTGVLPLSPPTVIYATMLSQVGCYIIYAITTGCYLSPPAITTGVLPITSCYHSCHNEGATSTVITSP